MRVRRSARELNPHYRHRLPGSFPIAAENCENKTHAFDGPNLSNVASSIDTACCDP